MHTRTEDLLSVRDNEPMEAELRARLTADPDCIAEIDRLRDVREALRRLPQLQPSSSWESIAAAARPTTGAARGRAWAAFAAAAVLAAVAIWATDRDGKPPEARDAPAAVTSSGFEPGGGETARRDDDPILPPHAALLRESARLERLLDALPRQRPIMSAGTAGTIAVLEDRIYYIDGQLTVGAAEGLEPPQQLALWRERVDVMNALLQVRYAQAQPVVY